jgi:Ca2+/Na+ antiporter
MIQRIQTVYLLLAAIAALLTFFFPYAHFYSGDLKVAEYAMFGVFNVQSETVELSNLYGFPAWAMGVIATLVPLVAIFLFKKRPVQYRIARLAYLVNMVYVVYLFFGIDKANDVVFEGSLSVMHHVGFYLPVAAVVFAFLGVRGIKKDEDLVKSLDRIR